MNHFRNAWIFIFLFSFSIVGQAASLEPSQALGTAWVQVMPDSEVPLWKAQALEGAISHFLGEYDKFSLVKNVSNVDPKCANDSNCLLHFARSHNIDVVIAGRLEARKIQLIAYETWTNSIVRKTEFSLHESKSLTEFRHAIFKLVRPFIQIGGLIDQHASRKLNPDQITSKRESGISPQSTLIWLGLTVPLFLFFWIPRLFYWFVNRKSHFKKRNLTDSSDFRLMNIIVYLSSFGIVALWLLIPHFLSPPTQIANALEYMPKDVVKAWPALKFFKGGAAWASVLVLGHSFASSRLKGLERVGHLALFPVLRSWALVFVGKSLVLFFAWMPFVYLGEKLSQFLNLDVVTTWAVTVPFLILVGTLWFLIWLGYITLLIDQRLVSGLSSEKNPWHRRIEKYFRGYLNRSGQINEEGVRPTLYLPAKTDVVVTYGGAFLRPRILLSSWMLPYVMGPLPGRQEDEETGFADFTSGMVIPQKRRKSESTGFASFLRFKKKEIEPTYFRSQAAHPFNLQKATILGYILPYRGDESAPLIANNRDDFEVVTELMTEHYLQFDKDQEDLELDDTDPTHKDFLFGLLMREQGTIEHQDQFFTTFILGLSYLGDVLPKHLAFLRNWGAGFLRIYEINLSKYPVLLADCYASFNHGRNHLVQYLYYRLVGRRQSFTSRADSGYLYATSQNIFENVRQLEATKDSRYIRYATFEHRIHWIAELFFGAPPASTQTFHRRLFRILFILMIFSLAALPFENAYRYHEVYLQRLQNMKEKINKQQAQLQERENVREQQQ